MPHKDPRQRRQYSLTWRKANKNRVAESNRRTSNRMAETRRIILEEMFGVKTPGALMQLWLEGEIAIIKDGSVVQSPRSQ